ncbi:MAG: small ribosomal subunit Rsm22 family protein [Firmicutes bacterium]|jgi:ribosomal protein RSM22 (predicted rRNA methylase)|nr:small ribosomal subunit Rsm22 family protein [Bacillota bacterium]
MIDIPPELTTAIDHELSGVPLGPLRAVVQNLSIRYRTRDFGPVATEDVQAYAAFRLPATFGAVSAAFNQIQPRLGNSFSPRSLLDIGSGPGTVMWSAFSRWPSIEQITLVERDPNMTAFGRRLQQHSSHEAIQHARWLAQDVRAPLPDHPIDLAVASYVLGELDVTSRWAVTQSLWALHPGLLVLVEPGTSMGFLTIRTLRQQLIAHGAQVVAPCPHDQSCPLIEDDWCHFGQRIPRSRLHRQAKSAVLGYEDEKFSFVAVSARARPMPSHLSRIVRRPQIAKGHVRLSLCTPEGVIDEAVASRGSTHYKRARNASWGDEFPLN